MIFLHIEQATDPNISKIDQYIKEGKHIFIFFYLEGCGPCNLTRPEWTKIKQVLGNKYDDNVVVIDIEQTFAEQLQTITEKPTSFPDIRYIHNNISEKYEGGRQINDFIEWINKKINLKQNGGIRKKNMRLTHNKIAAHNIIHKRYVALTRIGGKYKKYKTYKKHKKHKKYNTRKSYKMH